LRQQGPEPGALVIPRAPARLRLPLERRWDGGECPDPGLHGELSLALLPGALEIAGSLAHQHPARIPAAPSGSRVANLWEYDVVECFLVGRGGRYLEVELGAGGHFLVLEFDAPRRRRDEHAALAPALAFRRDPDRWHASLRLPLALLPPGLRALNAFAIAGGSFLAFAPVPGAVPDFHQPEAFPRAALASGDA
jgi:hypothetical protein